MTEIKFLKEESDSRKSGVSKNGSRRRGSIKSSKSRKKSSERRVKITPKGGRKEMIRPLNERLEELKNQLMPLAVQRRPSSKGKNNKKS